MINSAFTPGFLAVLGAQYALTDIQSVDDTTSELKATLGETPKTFRFPKMDIGDMFVGAPLISFGTSGELINDVIARAMNYHEAGLVSGVDFDLGEEQLDFQEGTSVYLNVKILSSSLMYKGSFGLTVYRADLSPLTQPIERDLTSTTPDYPSLDWMTYLSTRIFNVEYDIEIGDSIPESWKTPLWPLLYAMDQAFNIDEVLNTITGSEVLEKYTDEISNLVVIKLEGGELTLRYTFDKTQTVTYITDFELPGDPAITDALLP